MNDLEAFAKLVQALPIKSRAVVSHIRQANRGCVSLENTHPFTRELWGRVWTFAHNGQLKGVKDRMLTFYEPVGTTDSEHAFCWLLQQLSQRFAEEPAAEDLHAALRELALGFSAGIGHHGRQGNDHRQRTAFHISRLHHFKTPCFG